MSSGCQLSKKVQIRDGKVQGLPELNPINPKPETLNSSSRQVGDDTKCLSLGGSLVPVIKH